MQQKKDLVILGVRNPLMPASWEAEHDSLHLVNSSGMK
jgi:hypothetical protein